MELKVICIVYPFPYSTSKTEIKEYCQMIYNFFSLVYILKS